MAASKRNAEGYEVRFCADCGEECTAGTPKGPPSSDHTTLGDGKTRCRVCYPKYQQKNAALAGAARDLRDALAAMVRAFKRRTPLSTTASNRLLAKSEAALAKAEGL